MLANLKEVLDDIEQVDEWAHKFASDLIIREEELLAREPDARLKLTDKQFRCLVKIHERFCTGNG